MGAELPNDSRADTALGRNAPPPHPGAVDVRPRYVIGTALIEALAEKAAEHFSALTLNVHLLSPAARPYTRTGFRVAGAGRGSLGVAMSRPL